MRIVVDVEEPLGKEFRKAVIDKFGAKKGALRQAITEAIKLWLEQAKGRSPNSFANSFRQP